MDLKNLTEHEFVVSCRTLVRSLEKHTPLVIERAETTMHRGLLIYVQGEFNEQQAESAVRDICCRLSPNIKPEQVEFLPATKKRSNQWLKVNRT